MVKSEISEKDNRIKIIYLIDFIESEDGLSGGTERQLIELVHRINRQRFHVVLICLRQNENSEIFKKLDCEKINLNFRSFKSFKTFIILFKLTNFLRNNKSTITQSFFFDSIQLGVIASKIAGVKHIISCRRDMGFWYSKALLNRLYYLNKLTSKILVNCNAVRENIVRVEKVKRENVDVIYNGLDLKKIDEQPAIDLSIEFQEISEKDQVVGIVANFNRQVKRLDLFIKSLAEIQKKHSKIAFVIVGEGCLKNELVRLSVDLGCARKLIWAGRMENPIPVIKSFDIAVQPSDSEGFSNSILEYMACSVPVIATNVGGNNELIEEGKSGYLVPPDDPLALANRIDILLYDKILAEKLGKYGRFLAESRFGWDSKVKEIENYYEELTRNK